MTNLNEFMAMEVMGWEKCGGYYFFPDPDERHCRTQNWNPTEDIAQAAMCLDKSQENIVIEMNHVDDDKPHSVNCVDVFEFVIWTDLEGLPRAICEATRTAIEGEK